MSYNRTVILDVNDKIVACTGNIKLKSGESVKYKYSGSSEFQIGKISRDKKYVDNYDYFLLLTAYEINKKQFIIYVNK